MLYCPYCNRPLDFNLGYWPSECPSCGGAIAYTKGGTAKAWFKWKMSIKEMDIIVVILLVVTLSYTAYEIWKKYFQFLSDKRC